ncbi:MAG: hypothetical protein KAI83_09970 [Thiomargarita sp.]|nr:hypothetical protein [Thiomargarita sp.]
MLVPLLVKHRVGRATAKPTIYLNEKVGFVPLPTLRLLILFKKMSTTD